MGLEKKKIVLERDRKYKAHKVIKGFKDKNTYDLSETYPPVLRLTSV